MISNESTCWLLLKVGVQIPRIIYEMRGGYSGLPVIPAPEGGRGRDPKNKLIIKTAQMRGPVSVMMW